MISNRKGREFALQSLYALEMGQNDLDWNKEITATPNDIGFDYSFIMPATNDRVPCVLRDPQSHVARSYLSVCDVLAAAGSNVKERNDGKNTPGRASFGQFR